MFGVVPRSIWQKTNPPDEHNLCTWAMRCLLVEDDDRLMLIDTGMGNKQDERFFRHYHPQCTDGLLMQIEKAGFAADAVTDVLLTHLHFDHCGGAVQWQNGEVGKPELTFKNARYWSNREHWKWATQPNARERASFLEENILPIEESGQLHFLDFHNDSPMPGVQVVFADGHTEKQMIPHIQYKEKIIVFAADLLPSVGHIPLPYVMGYDTRPLITLQEKGQFLHRAIEKEHIVFFEHDPMHECCTLKMTEKGPRLKETFPLSEVL